jgi:3-phenylpropionate/cinnamic acid dioxygenase small subunit
MPDSAVSDAALIDSSPVTPPVARPVDPDLAAFIYLEARLADEARYSEWESLWADDALYWVPMSPDADPDLQVSYVYDNRRRLKSRVAQLNSGSRHSQTPPSVMRRTVSNLEVLAQDDDTTTIGSNFALYEYRYGLTIWAGRYIHRIRTAGERPLLAAKTVHLVNAGGPIQTMSFLI